MGVALRQVLNVVGWGTTPTKTIDTLWPKIALKGSLVDMTVDEPVRIYLLMRQRTSCNAEMKEIC